ncbi:MAG: hypothetical protein KC983_03580 [Phycisphaerales bacterium]|nr:hypothetical protein [Phycisphaerales bacterium]
MIVQLGQLLVHAGVLTQDQVEAALLEQARTGDPLGLICEERFGVDPERIETAWAMQYAQITRTVDPLTEVTDSAALELVSRRQAWQFSVLPLRFDGSELMLATTQENLQRALRFANKILGVPAYFVLADREALGAALCRHYPINGLTSTSLDTTVPGRRLMRAFR